MRSRSSKGAAIAHKGYIGNKNTLRGLTKKVMKVKRLIHIIKLYCWLAVGAVMKMDGILNIRRKTAAIKYLWSGNNK